MSSHLPFTCRTGEVRAAYAAVHQEVTALLDPAIAEYLSKGLPVALLNGARLLYRGTYGEDNEGLARTTATIREKDGRGFQLSHEKLGWGGHALRHQPSVNLWHPDFSFRGIRERDDGILAHHERNIEMASKIVEVLRSPETRFEGLLLPTSAR